ncbi:MAG: YIP1 family protein, partial [Eubacterium sp.]
DYVNDMGAVGLFFEAIVSAVFTLLIGAAFIAFFYWIIGKLFKGIGTFKDLYKGAMITSMPFILIVPFALVWLFMSPETYLDTKLTSGTTMILMIIVSVASFIASVYAFILTIVMISEVHKITKWKAFFTMILPTLILVAFILFIGAILMAALV